MNVDPPDALVAILPTTTLGSMLGRAFMLDGELPPDIEACVSSLPGQPRSSQSTADCGEPSTED